MADDMFTGEVHEIAYDPISGQPLLTDEARQDIVGRLVGYLGTDPRGELEGVDYYALIDILADICAKILALE